MTIVKELLALNQQVVGLRRAGSPVSLGLPRNPAALEARLNQLTSELSSRMDADVSTADATETGDSGNDRQGSAAVKQRLLDSDSLPAPYHQTVEVGVRQGRLSSAFEGITESAHIANQLRQDTWIALAYPILVTVIAFILLGSLAAYSLRQFATTHYVMRIPNAESTNTAAWLGSFGWGWAFVPIVLLVLYFVVRWIARQVPEGKTFKSTARWLPGFGRIDRDLRLASFTETLLQLRRNGVLRSDAMPLASAISGHSVTYDKFGERITPESVPPLLRWALYEAETKQSDDADGDTVEINSLQIAADVYHERAVQRSRSLSRRLPVIMCILVGICVVLVYALIVWLPFCNMLNELSNSTYHTF